MSDSPPSLQPLDPQPNPEFDSLPEVSPSLNQQTLNLSNPPLKSDPETVPPLDLEYNSPEEEEAEEGEEIGEGQEQEQGIPAITSGMSLRIDPPTTDPISSVSLTSPSGDSSTRRAATKRKKGKGKGKSHAKKQQAIEEKYQTLKKNLNPIPFIPTRILDFAKHEKLFKKLGLWDFVHIDFDRSIRVDLIAQLVASYNPKLRSSYVNECRLMVNRADLARAFKLPLKKERGNVEVDLDSELISEDSIGFVVDFLSKWVLLHEDTWEIPSEVNDWMKLIKDGHPEKVDWAGLLWFMVEKEVKQGGRLKDCYYASHMQQLIKSQREKLVLEQLPVNVIEEDTITAENVEAVIVENVEAVTAENVEAVTAENVEAVGSIPISGEEDPLVGGPSTELTLGQDGDKEEEMKDMDMMEAEKSKDSDEEGEEEEEQVGVEEQGRWLLNGNNHLEDHILQRCGGVNNEEFTSFEYRKDDEELDGDGDMEQEGEEDMEQDEEEAENEFNVFTNVDGLEGDGFTGNLLEAVDGNRMPFSSHDHLHNSSSMDVRADMPNISSAPSFFNNSGKRVLEHDNHISHHSIDDNNKRLRISDPWEDKPLDFGMCMEQIAQMTERARVLYAEREQSMVQSNVNQQILLDEVLKRDDEIAHLHKSIQKKESENLRLEHELFIMQNVLAGYRKALRDVQKSFEEYRERAKLAEEPTYKDTGEGGLMLTAPELEKLRRKREEEYKMKCMLVEQKMKEVEQYFDAQFSGYVEKINHFDKRLMGLETDAKGLVALYAKRETQQTEENVAAGSKHLPNIEPGVKVAEVSEPLLNPEPEEKVPDSPQIQEAEATSREGAEPPQIPAPKEKVPEVPESPHIPEPEAQSPEAPEVAEPPQNE